MAIKFCFLCYKGINSLGNHLRWEHNDYSIKKYYDKFLKKETEGHCLNCGKETTFSHSKIRYNTYCCTYCMKHSDVYKQRCAVGVSKVWASRFENERKEISKKALETSKKNPNYEINKKLINVRMYANKTEDEIKEIKEKRIKSSKETWKNRTKEDNMEMQKKTRKTKKKKYGNETYNNREQAKKTMKDKTGYEYWQQIPENRKLYSDKFKNYTEEEWNTFKENVSQGILNRTEQEKEEWQKHRQETISNYTTKQREEIRKKKQETWNKKSKEEKHEIARKQAHNSNHKYFYKGIDFHSFDEMAYYIFNIECTSNKIIRNNNDFYLEYEFEGKLSSYYPDFKVNDKIVEIKGLHFFKNKDPNEIMICPYHYKKDTPEIIDRRNRKFEAKHQCMLKNNVKIITDTKLYIDYVINKYGRKIRID